MKAVRKCLIQAGFVAGLLTIAVGLPAITQTQPTIRQGLPGRRLSGSHRCKCGPTEKYLRPRRIREAQ